MLLFLIACVQSAAPVDLPVDTGAGSTAACDTRIVQAWPAAGALDVWLEPVIAVELEPPDPSASLVLLSVAGGEVKATTAVVEGGGRWSLRADDALSEGTDYALVVDTCAGEERLDFTTVDAPGLPPELALAGVAYRFDPRFGRLVEPAGLEDALAALWPDQPWLLAVAVDGAGLELDVGASTAAQAQDTCVVTQTLPDAQLDGAHLTAGPALTTLDLQVGSLTLYDLSFGATFAHDGGELAGLELVALLDARDLAGLALLGTSSDAVCDSLARDGVACQDCGDGVLACVTARWDSITAPIADGLGFESISSPDCHPDCAASWSNPLCNRTGWEQ